MHSGIPSVSREWKWQCLTHSKTHKKIWRSLPYWLQLYMHTVRTYHPQLTHQWRSTSVCVYIACKPSSYTHGTTLRYVLITAKNTVRYEWCCKPSLYTWFWIPSYIWFCKPSLVIHGFVYHCIHGFVYHCIHGFVYHHSTWFCIPLYTSFCTPLYTWFCIPLYTRYTIVRYGFVYHRRL